MATSPIGLSIDAFEAMLNLELSDHPVYDGLELQRFDDEDHGTGLLAFLSRRADQKVDYYPEPGLRLDRDQYNLGAGTGEWTETRFEIGRLRITDEGADAEVGFTDIEGRRVEIRVDDRTARRRRRAALLAPIGDGVTDPHELLLVWMPLFDLAHESPTPPSVCIDGEEAVITRLPGRWLHRRHLVKYAAPVVTASLGRSHDGSATVCSDTIARTGDHEARLSLTPDWPAADALADGGEVTGAWQISIDGVVLTGGTWFTRRRGLRMEMGLDVTLRWKPDRLPWLMGLATTVVPVFRRWPTTYRWRAVLDEEADAHLAGGWERTNPTTTVTRPRSTPDL